MDHTKHIKILYGLVVVLLVVVVGIGLLWHYSAKNTPMYAAGQNMPVLAASSTQPDLSKVVVGAGGAVMQYAKGTITEVGGNSIKIKDANTNAVDTIAISANTTLQIGGKIKDSATQQKELAAYNAGVTTLLKDPVKNQAALAALRLPSTEVLTPATLADFSVGDVVLVSAGSIDASGTYIATIVTKNPAQ
jgi:hypothetical protein